jgi:polyisoprenoid-binding protein YceI
MNHMRTFSSLLLCTTLFFATPPTEGSRTVDVAHSSLRIRVYKSGLFSAFGHNHEIEAPLEAGEVVELGDLSVVLHVDARKLKVLDPEVGADTRAQVQQTMQGPEVLDSAHFPEIRFESVKIEAKGQNGWTVRGNLTLHGQSHPINFDVALSDGLYRGTATIKQTDFGITPVSVAGGSVKVKDDVKVEFGIALRN